MSEGRTPFAQALPPSADVQLPPYARRLDVRAARAAFAAGTLSTVGDHPSGEDVQRDVEVRDANRYDAHGMESHDSTKDTFGRGGASLRDSGEGVPTGSLRDAPGKAARTFLHVGSPWHAAMLRAAEQFTPEPEFTRQARLRRWQTIR